MAAEMKQGAAARDRDFLSAQCCKESMRETLRALQSCVGKLQQTEDAVSFSINWDKIQCLPGVEPASLYSALQQHITDLKPILDQLQSLAKSRSEKRIKQESTGDCCHDADVVESEQKIVTGNAVPDCGFGNKNVTDPSLVQIQAGKSEIDRRILAFIERKQVEINENNVREFCNVIDCNQEDSCARTDAVFTPFPGYKSHIKVSRVVNAYGPQTRPNSSNSSSSAHALHQECENQAVEERLQNIECHLRLKPGGPVPNDIYHRIKKLEDRILELEGISPEYFQSMDVSNKRRKVTSSQSYSLVEIDQKISALRQSLLQKSKQGIS